MSRRKEPRKYTLAEIIAIADKQFPPPWSVIEAIVKLEGYVKSHQANIAKRVSTHKEQP